MTNEEKAVIYGRLLNEHTRVGNKISEIKGQDINLTNEQKEKIRFLETTQIKIMRDINRLFS